MTMPPTTAQVSTRLLTIEIEHRQLREEVDAMKTLARSILFAIISASVGVMVTIVAAAIYVGGRLHAVEDLDRRVTRIEDRRQDEREVSR
jgi:ribosomal protein S8